MPNGQVLNMGGGTGYPVTSHLANKGFSVSGIDFSESMILKAKAINLPNAQFYLSDFYDFDPIELCDGIIAFSSFFHFPKTTQCMIHPGIA